MNPNIRQITPEMLQRLRTTQQQPPTMPSRETANPLPDGDEGIRALRAFSACAIPEESNKVNALIQKSMAIKTLATETEDALGKSVVTILRANRHCEENLKSRIVCDFNKDETLAKLHTSLKVEQETLTRLQREIEGCVHRGSELEQSRWETAVKTCGLNPEKYSYRVDETAGTISLVELDCTQCQGPIALHKMTQELTRVLMNTEVKNDHT
jgi:hypothetical protein